MVRIVISLFTLLLIANGCSADNQVNTYYSVTELREDFLQLKKLINENHPKYFTNISQLNSTFDSQFAKINDSMTEIEFMRLLGPVISAVKCGHMRMYTPEATYQYLVDSARIIPLEIKVINDTLYVIFNCSADSEIKPGWIVKSINGHSSQSIINNLKNCYSADGDNETYKYYNINLGFNTRYYIYIDKSNTFDIAFINPATGTEIGKKLNGIIHTEYLHIKDSLNVHREQYKDIRTFFADDDSYAVLDINTFVFYESLDSFTIPVRQFFIDLREQKINSLILDVRDNDGGDPNPAVFLLSYLLKNPAPYFSYDTPFYDDLKKPIQLSEYRFDGDLYILINGFCFSTTGHLLSLLKYYNRGTIIGEESGGSYACNDASGEYYLSNTGIRINLPRRTFKTAVDGLTKGRGIIPDIKIKPTIADLINGRDPVMENAVELIENK
ncbi:MAG: S41 family peptidase [Candidatus Zixiibacteriota bacterium]